MSKALLHSPVARVLQACVYLSLRAGWSHPRTVPSSCNISDFTGSNRRMKDRYIRLPNVYKASDRF